jgi:MarR family transcriptional regulator, lower aerobic nicotinate degradation pathway regulator
MDPAKTEPEERPIAPPVAPSMDALYAMPGHLVRRAQQISTALFADECAAFDLTSVQYAALHAIARHAGVDATRLSALIAFDRSTIGDVLLRMERKGWIRRGGAPGDRRVKRVELTPEGALLLRRVEEAVGRVQARLLAPLSPADRPRFMRMLARVAGVQPAARAKR